MQVSLLVNKADQSREAQHSTRTPIQRCEHLQGLTLLKNGRFVYFSPSDALSILSIFQRQRKNI